MKPEKSQTPSAGHDESRPLLPDEPVKQKTGYELNDLVKAPIEPPELKDTRGPRPRQWYVVSGGIILAAIGLLGWPLWGAAAAIAIMAAGGLFVLLGVLLRI